MSLYIEPMIELKGLFSLTSYTKSGNGDNEICHDNAGVYMNLRMCPVISTVVPTL